MIFIYCPHRFQVPGLIEGQWYAYRVRAFNKLGAGRPCRATDDIQAVDARGRPAVVARQLHLSCTEVYKRERKWNLDREQQSFIM